MTKSEVAKLIYVIQATYPRFFENADIDNMVEAWTFALDEFTYEQASLGLKTYITTDTKGFPPSPGQIIDGIRRVEDHPVTELTAAEAWQLVYKAMESLRWEAPEIEFNKLPPECKRAIGSPEALKEIASMDIDHVMIGEKARFMRQYDAVKESVRDYERLPQKAKERINLLQAVANGEMTVAQANEIHGYIAGSEKKSVREG